MPPIEEIIMSAPPPRVAMPGHPRLANQMVAFTLAPMILSKASSESFASGPNTGLAAALHTRTSMPPNCLLVPATSASTSSRRDTLQVMTIASPPFWRMPAATASHGSCLRLDTTTLAPMPARHSTMARPMPLLDPVTTATLPARSNGFDMLLPPEPSMRVMPGLVPGIHVFKFGKQDVDGRDKPGHDA